MAGALTANTTAAIFEGDDIPGSGTTFGTVEFLSPVEGANNVLLTAVLAIGVTDVTATITAVWQRCLPGATLAETANGDVVGVPFVIASPETENTLSPVVVQAIDRGPGVASAYAIVLSADQSDAAYVDDSYLDAVLYD